MIAELVATPSVSSTDPVLDMGNRPVAERVAAWLDDLGFSVRLLPVPGEDGKVNLVAVLGQGEGGLVMSGHLDTVPVDADRWSSDPFEMVERDGRVFGLGTADMKAFFAIAVAAARTAAEGELRSPLVLLGTADEETNMSGARALRAADLAGARQAVIGEPTGMRPVHMHKGVMMERIRVLGHSGHSSDPALGANALEGMHAVLGAVLGLRDRMLERRDTRFDVPFPTLNAGAIRGGDNANRICSGCELLLDIRPLPGMDIAEIRLELHEAVRRSLDRDDLEIQFESVFDGLPPLETDAQSSIVRAAHEITGIEPGSAAFGTEGPYLAALGLETLVLGPGDISVAHQPDEYLSLGAAEAAVQAYTRLIHRFCH